ncbi:hypothetical protein ABZU32_35690 [Sphaerisporangium sp. NPDC005288]
MMARPRMVPIDDHSPAGRPLSDDNERELYLELLAEASREHG